MPNLPEDNKIIAILCSDFHLSQAAPVWRSNEPNWYGAMRQPLLQLCSIQEQFDVPVLIAGDVFDKWNSSPKLINFALKYFPEKVWAIPGQHDLPLHNYDNLEDSAYRTLEIAGRLSDLPAKSCIWINQYMSVTSFPWGFPITPCESDHGIKIALVHEYAWIKGHSYPTAPRENMLRLRSRNIIDNKHFGYDVIVYGDNHKGFQTKIGSTEIFNCGGFMRRHSDQLDYKPMVGLLTQYGKVIPFPLNTKGENHLSTLMTPIEGMKEAVDMTEFKEELQKLGVVGLDYFKMLNQFLRDKKVKKKIKKIINEIMD